MTKKQYRLNKWGTRLLKDNRPLFDWFNDSDEIVDLLNALCDEIEQFKKQKEYLERKIQRERTSAMKEHEKWEKEVIELIREQRKFIDDLNKENEQLKQILNELSNRLQFDVENEIRSYPVKLSEYLCNALKELQE